MHEDFERCVRAVHSRDARFDGWFFTAVTSTRIDCRPSCPVPPPQVRHMTFLPSAAAAQQAGFRACKRCRPDASPGEAGAAGDPAAPGSPEEAEALVRAIHSLGPDVVVVTGGHREQAIDVFFDGRRLVELAGARHPDGAAHGSGCTHSAALAAQLARGLEPLEAARQAQQIASEAVRDGLREVGAGAGPVDVLGLDRRR